MNIIGMNIYLQNAEEVINNLSNCQCCQRHQINRPRTFETNNQNNQNNILGIFVLHNCQCPCRNYCRFINRAFS